MEAAQTALEHLSGEDAGATLSLAHAQQALLAQSDIEPEFQTLSDQLAASLAQAEDAAHSLQTWLRRADLDPQGLAELDARLGLWVSLARRYKERQRSCQNCMQVGKLNYKNWMQQQIWMPWKKPSKLLLRLF